MKCDTYPPFDPQRLVNDIADENEHASRKLFKDKIQIGFLLKIKAMVFKKLGPSFLAIIPLILTIPE